MGSVNYSVLKERILRYDGVNIVAPDYIGHLLLSGVEPNYIMSVETNQDIEKFNILSDVEIKIYSEDTDIKLDYSWNIPKYYLDLDLTTYFTAFINDYNRTRVLEELEIVLEFNIQNEIRTIIFIIDELKKRKIVWGVGRGSSCASCLLFLVGVHCVDPIKYNIPLEEFYHL